MFDWRQSELQCLRHLRELKADGNRITSLDGLQKLEALTRLSVQGNLIQEVDFSLFRWYGVSSSSSVCSVAMTWHVPVGHG